MDQKKKVKQELEARPKSMEVTRSSDQRKREPEASEAKTSRRVWDCDSSLYDSFELNTFKRELDSAISCRTMSMPHLSDHRAPLPPPQHPVVVEKKPSSKLSRSLNKFLRSVFTIKTKSTSNFGHVFDVKEKSNKIKDGFYVVYDKSGALTTIPEVVPHEFSFLSPEIGSLVTRTRSERFSSSTSSNSISISCV